ncbi:MAG: flagellar hook-basal body complex protein FliE [Gammaproteobacteria bacterium]|nr:flagellar hook-basal body complex protein FliE [Gammaproteobacteria bacterium]
MDNSMQVSQLLENMQSIRSKMPAFENQIDVVGGLGKSDAISGQFSNHLKTAIDSVNAVQQESAQLSTAFIKGEPGVDLTQVMIAMEKSSISFQALTQVRNKMVEAYREVMNMQV